jgi:hypothetical protein
VPRSHNGHRLRPVKALISPSSRQCAGRYAAAMTHPLFPKICAPLFEAEYVFDIRYAARQDNSHRRGRPECPTGKSAKVCPALPIKIFRLTRRANQWFNSARLTQMRGGSRSSRTRGEMRWTRRPRLTSVADADGEVVWSWRPDAGVKLRGCPRGDGGKKARSPGRARYKP